MSSLYPPHQPYNAPSHKPTYSYKRSAIPSSPYLLRFKKKHVPMVSFGWPWPARAAHCLERQQKSLVPTRSDGWGRIRKCRPRGIEIWEFGVPNLSAAASLALESLAGAICCLCDWYSWDGNYNTCFLGEYDSANHVWETYINQLVQLVSQRYSWNTRKNDQLIVLHIHGAKLIFMEIVFKFGKSHHLKLPPYGAQKLTKPSLNQGF